MQFLCLCSTPMPHQILLPLFSQSLPSLQLLFHSPICSTVYSLNSLEKKKNYLENKLNSCGHQNSEKPQDSLCLVHITAWGWAGSVRVTDSLFWLGHAIWQTEGILQIEVRSCISQRPVRERESRQENIHMLRDLFWRTGLCWMGSG